MSPPPGSLHSAPKHHASLANRLLFPTHNTSSSLPPLVNSQIPPELTAELYDFIALALRAFVNPWWSKITRYDKEFLPQISIILTHVARALEQRILAADLPPLIFRDIPVIVTQHYHDYRNAAAKISSSYASGGALSLPQLFHQLQPHTAVSPDGNIDPEYIRQIVDHILKVCLPEQDYTPHSERFIVREIIVKIVLNDIVPKLVQPWFINKLLLDTLGQQSVSIPIKSVEASPIEPNQPSTSFSFHTIIVIILSAIQSISGACLALIHAYKQAVTTIKLVNQSALPKSSPSLSRRPSQTSMPELPPLSRASSISVSSSTSSLPPTPVYPSTFPPHVMNQLMDDPDHNYAQPPLEMVAEIFNTSQRHASSTILGTAGMAVSCFTPFLDRLLPYLLTNLLSTTFLFNVVRTAKRTLFPNGYPAPPPPDPTPEEQAEMRAKILAWRGGGPLLSLLLGPDPSATIGAALDPLSSVPCNRHLMVLILDRIFVTLFPELVNEAALGGDT
uniref:PXA domain-containing protein n=1 Tax=Moniliophthora roreri TaxID=221103 RepID=A0A0W0FY59_MONRR